MTHPQQRSPSASLTAPAQPTRRRALGLLGALASTSVLPGVGMQTARASTNANQQGLSGAWYNPDQVGQGLMVEAYPDLLGNGLGLLFAGWFTYSETAGGLAEQRWYSLSGEITAGSDAVPVTIYRNTGGQFNAAPATFAQGVGSGVITFSSCTAGTLSYQFNDGRTGSIPLRRLLDNVVCVDSGSTVDSDFAFSGAWFDPNIAGQGLVLEVNPLRGVAYAAWYTYAADGSGQRWYTAQGSYQRGQSALELTLYASSGGQFDRSTPTTTTAIGTAQLRFNGCNAATFGYAFNSGELAGRSGSITLSRTGPSPGACAFSSTCALIPSETEGPYPLLSVLANPAIVRADISEGRAGVPLTILLKLVNINNNCAPVGNAAVYVWHCDKDGVYSGYAGQTGGTNATGESFMRGVQTSDSGGQAIFKTIYPGWYAGRITHVHFRVYLNNSTSGSGVATSQIAFPLNVTSAVYASTLYAARGQNTSVTSFAADNVFRDGTQFQLASLSGNPVTGYIATLIVGIAA